MSRSHALVAVLGLATWMLGSCSPALPPIRFAPAGTDRDQVRRDFPLTDAERLALTPEAMRSLTQDQVDQIYARLTCGTDSRRSVPRRSLLPSRSQTAARASAT